MIQTANYQLSQWESTDRILMSDFNSDNSKIDAALGELTRRSKLITIADEDVSDGDTQTVTYSLADVDWTQYHTVHVYAWAKASGSSNYQFGHQRSSGLFVSLAEQNSETALHMVLYPLYSGATNFHGILFQENESTDTQIFSQTESLGSLLNFAFYAPALNSTISQWRLRILGQS